MINKKLMQIICLLCVAACFISLFGCSKEKPNEAIATYTQDISAKKTNDAIVTYPEDISTIADFKCVRSTDHETEFVIEDDNAKALYTYIREQWQDAEETQIDSTEQNYIYLSFQDGDPLLILNQAPTAEIVDDLDDLTVSDEHFYGVFWIYENDYMVFTAMPMTSFQKYYKMPEGTYDKITELIKK